MGSERMLTDLEWDTIDSALALFSHDFETDPDQARWEASESAQEKLPTIRAALAEADALREALREIVQWRGFADCPHCLSAARIAIQRIARAALGPSGAPTEGQGDG